MPSEPDQRIPALLGSHLWEFAKTTFPPSGAAPPEVFFAGVDDNQARVSVLWRALVPNDGEPLVPTPSAREYVDLPIWEVRDFVGDAAPAIRVSVDGATVETFDPARLRSGDRVVLAVDAGGYSNSGWDPHSTDPVTDLSPLTRGALRLSEPAITNLIGGPLDDQLGELIAALAPDPDNGPDPDLDRQVADSIVALLRSTSPETVDALWGTDSSITFRHHRINNGADLLLSWARQDQTPPSLPVDALDELSVAPSVSLPEHLASVGELAERLANAIGLPEDIVDAVGDAGRFHDLGKADRRFQRWLGNHDQDAPIAKSSMPIEKWQAARLAAGWPSGGRHELLSAQVLSAALAAGVTIPSAQLVHHLVLSHHGQGRPLCTTTTDGAALSIRATVKGTEIGTVADTRTPDWDQPKRFAALCEDFGLWGLALLEATLRQADHVVSRATRTEVQ